MKSNLLIESTDTKGAKVQKTIQDVNSAASNDDLYEFATKLIGLTTNTYNASKKLDFTELTSRSDPSSLKLKVTNISGSNACVMISGGSEYDGELSLYAITPTASASDAFVQFQTLRSYDKKKLIIYPDMTAENVAYLLGDDKRTDYNDTHDDSWDPLTMLSSPFNATVSIKGDDNYSSGFVTVSNPEVAE